MRPSRALVVLPAAAAVVVAGCGGGTSKTTAASAPSGSTSPAATVTSPSATVTSPAATQPPATRPSAGPASAWSTSPQRGAARLTDRVALLTELRTGRHTGYERVVLTFRGGVPGYDVRYVPRLVQDPGGAPVALRGTWVLAATFRGATIDTTPQSPTGQGQRYPGPRRIQPGYPVLKEVAAAGDFEAVLTFGLGLDRRAGFRVLTLGAPSRVVVDVSSAPVSTALWPDVTPQQAAAAQAAADQGHQPWRLDPAQVVTAYATAVLRWSAPVVRPAGPSAFRVVEPATGRERTLQVTQPVRQGRGGVWDVLA